MQMRILIASFQIVYRMVYKQFPSGNHWAVESEIFWQLRVETIGSALGQQSRVFSKNFLRQPPNGTTQVSGWRVVSSTPELSIS
jgi:hypothetical protein